MTTTTTPLNQEIPGVTTAAERATAHANSGRPVPGHIWTPTGARVVANDRAEIFRVFTEGVTGVTLMQPPEVFLADDTEGSRYDYTFIQINGGRWIYQEKKQQTSHDYRQDFINFKDHFVRELVLGIPPDGWSPNPLVAYTGFGWWRDGLDGYGQDWSWFFGERRSLASPIDLLYNNKPHIIATGSHRIDTNTRRPVDIFLPVHP